MGESNLNGALSARADQQFSTRRAILPEIAGLMRMAPAAGSA
jgi:hypothetical protein